jgi:hypothetical protein
VPFGPALLVLEQHVRGSFSAEIRVIEFLFHSGDLSLDFLEFFGLTRYFGGDILDTFERQEEIANFGVNGGRALLGLVIGIALENFCVEQEFEHLHVLRRNGARGLENKLYLFARGNVGFTAEIAALSDDGKF